MPPPPAPALDTEETGTPGPLDDAELAPPLPEVEAPPAPPLPEVEALPAPPLPEVELLLIPPLPELAALLLIPPLPELVALLLIPPLPELVALLLIPPLPELVAPPAPPLPDAALELVVPPSSVGTQMPSAHIPPGHGVAESNAQVPSEGAPAAIEQASQAPPLHSLLQHTPSTHLPLEHVFDARHGAPCPCLGTQTALLQ